MTKKIFDFIDSNDEIVLMSLREAYFNQMITGEKRCEYRKKYKKVPTKAFIYISRTKKSIGALIEFGQPIFGTAHEINQIAELEQPGSYKEIEDYLIGGIGVAIPIQKIYEFSPVLLSTLQEQINGFTVPQSYYMINEKAEILHLLKDVEVTHTYVMG